LIIICGDRKIRLYNLEDRTDTILSETEPLASTELSADNRYLLVNVVSHAMQELHLWDLKQQRVVQKFKAHSQSRYVIRSCFGGVDQAFVACGSEDSKIYIWHVELVNYFKHFVVIRVL